MKNSLEFCEALKKIKPLSEYLNIFSKKHGISSQAIILLYAMSNDIDLTDFFKESFYDELIKAVFIEQNSFGFRLTGKGSIIAKSIEIAIEKFENN